MSASNVDVARALLEGLTRGDLSVVGRMMTADVDYAVISIPSAATSEALPWAGRYSGPNAVKGYMQRLAAAQPGKVRIDDWISRGSTVVAFGEVDTASA